MIPANTFKDNLAAIKYCVTNPNKVKLPYASYNPSSGRFTLIADASVKEICDSAERVADFLELNPLSFSSDDLTALGKYVDRCAYKYAQAYRKINDNIDRFYELHTELNLLHSLKEEFKIPNVLDKTPTQQDFETSQQPVMLSYDRIQRKVFIHFLDDQNQIVSIAPGNKNRDFHYPLVLLKKICEIASASQYGKYPFKVMIIDPKNIPETMDHETIYIGIVKKELPLDHYITVYTSDLNKTAYTQKIYSYSEFMSMLKDKLQSCTLSLLQSHYPNYQFTQFELNKNQIQFKIKENQEKQNSELFLMQFSSICLINDQNDIQKTYKLTDGVLNKFEEFLQERREGYYKQYPFGCFKKRLVEDSDDIQPSVVDLEQAPWNVIISYSKKSFDLEGKILISHNVPSRTDKWVSIFDKDLDFLKDYLEIYSLLKPVSVFIKEYPDFKYKISNIIDHYETPKGYVLFLPHENREYSYILERRGIFNYNNFKPYDQLLVIYKAMKEDSLINLIEKVLKGTFWQLEEGLKPETFIIDYDVSLSKETKQYVIRFIYHDRINGEKKVVQMNAKTVYGVVDQITALYKKEEERYRAHLKEQYGEMIIEQVPTTLKRGQFVLLPRFYSNNFYTLAHNGSIVKQGAAFYKTKKTMAFFEEYQEFKKWLERYRSKEGAIVFHHVILDTTILVPNFCAFVVESRGDCKTHRIQFSNPLYEEDSGLLKFIEKNDIETSQLEEALKGVHDCYLELKTQKEEMCKEDVLEPSLKTRAKTYAGTDTPKLLPEGKVALLMDFFMSINFTEPKKPHYVNPKDIQEEKRVIPLGELKNNIKHFIQVVEEERPGYYGVPENREERKAYYFKLKSFLSQIIVKLKDQAIEPLLRQECLLAFAIGGTRCGGRWMGEVIQQYRALFGQGAKNVDDFILSFIDRIKVGIIEEMVNEGTQNTHEFLAMCKALRHGTGLGIPASAGADYNDPYAADALIGKYQTTEEILTGFMDKFTAPEIIVTVFDQLNDEIKRTKGNFITLLNEPFREIILKEMAANEELKRIEQEYEVAKKAILSTKTFTPENVHMIAAIDIGALKSAPVIDGKGFIKMHQQLLGKAYEELQFEWKYITENSDDVESEKAKELMRIQNDYAIKVRCLKDFLMDKVSEKRRSAIYQLTQKALLGKYFYILDEHGFPKQLTRRGARTLLLHYGYLEEG